MSVPPLLIGAALVFWGWQTGNLLVGALLAIALEAARHLSVRFDLGTPEHSTIADLCTIGFVLLAAILAANRGIAHGILEAFTWLPVALSPILAAQILSASGRIPLSALFRYMRKLRRENPQIKDPPVDVSAVYVVLAALAAGVANQRGPGFYAGVVAAAACMIFAARPRRASAAAAALMLAAAAALGHAGHVGLSELQASLEEWVIDFQLRGVDSDPYRTRTAIGSLGRIKQYDTILARVYASERDAERVRLLHRASYNTYDGTAWLARQSTMEPIEPEPGGPEWVLHREAPEWRVRIATRLENGRGLLALPAATTRIAELPVTAARRNSVGAVHVDFGADWIQYEALGAGTIRNYAPPNEFDQALPQPERETIERLAAELGLRALPGEEALRRVERHLGGFAYSTYRERAVPRGDTALGDFLTRTRAGHCEYFAAAATLLLRAAGIPARYATGFAVIEHSALEGAFIVRARHAHAWTRAWVDGRWVDFDTTPAVWFEEEERGAPLWQGLSDLFRWAGFRWTQRGEFKAGDGWYAVLALLALILAWRVFRGRRVVKQDDSGAAVVKRRFPGEDSEFYAVEKALAPREIGESHAAWLRRIARDLPAERLERLREALRLHSRYRFDPQGLDGEERGRLREICRSLAAVA